MAKNKATPLYDPFAKAGFRPQLPNSAKPMATEATDEAISSLYLFTGSSSAKTRFSFEVSLMSFHTHAKKDRDSNAIRKFMIFL